MKRIFTLLILALLVLPQLASSQSFSKNQQKKILRQARNYLYAAEYVEAYPFYKELYESDTNNSVYNYEFGICIYEGSREKLNSKKYFEKIEELNEREGKPELFYYLGRLYHLEHNFLYATAAYSTYLAEGLPAGKVGVEMEKEVNLYILQCEDGRDLLESKRQILESVHKQSRNVTKYQIDSISYVTLENLGEEINSSFDEYGPIIMDNSEVLLFTSRRGGSAGSELFSDGQYYEDIYLANFQNGIWAEVNNINNTDYFNGAFVNTNGHNATVSVSPDESELFVYTKSQCDIIKRKIGGEHGTWLSQESFSENFDKAGVRISHVTISPDLKVLYVEAERHDSYGERDLYSSILQDNGTWGELQNLGPRINTKMDEVAPFLLNDTVLYFSSKGHSSIGGWDVFVSHKRDTGWTFPENLGIPVNTPFDEVNYMIAHGVSKAYYSSSREGGYGGFDIYTITNSEVKDIEDIEDDSTLKKVLIVDVFVDENKKVTEDTKKVLAEAQAKIEGNLSWTVKLIATSPSKSGKDGADIAKENAEKAMAVLVDAGIAEDRISITYNSSDRIASNDVPFKANYEEIVYFGSDSKHVTEWSKEKKVKPLLEYLKEKPNAKIYLSGHSDHVGKAEYNLTLSRDRTDSVEKYLKDNGVNNPIRKEYFGEALPRYTVEEVYKDPKSLIYNRRVKIVIF